MTRRTVALLCFACLSLLAGAPSREDVLKQWADEGKKRVEDARAACAKKKQDAARRRASEEKRVVDATAKTPVDVSLANGKTFKGCSVLSVRPNAFVLRSTDPDVKQMGAAFASLTPRCLYSLRQLMVADDDLDGRLNLGRLAARLGLYAEAQKDFDWVVAKDASYQDRLPDLQQLKERGSVFHGKMTPLGGDRWQVVYDFQREEEGLDFTVDGGDAKVEKGSLTLTGKGDTMAVLKELALVDEVVLSAEGPAPADGVDAYWGLLFTCAAGKSYGIAVSKDAKGAHLLTQETSEGSWSEVKQFDAPEGSGAVHVRLARGTALSVTLGAQEVWSHAVPRVQSGQVFLQGESEEEGTVSFTRVEVQARLSKEWLRKAREDVEAAALRTLEEDLMQGESEGAAPALPQLSAETLAGEGLPQKDLAAIHEMMQKAEIDDEEFAKDVKWLDEQLQSHPKWAAAWYVLAEGREFEGKEAEQLDALAKAIECEPAFHEALARRASARVDRRECDAARKDIEQALSVRPDDSAAIRARGALSIAEKRYSDAEADFELALALDPSDEEAKSNLRCARHLLTGPWPEGSPRRECVKETEHYVVRTDISQAKAEQYAARLEKAREEYEKGTPPAKGQARKAVVLVFDSEEAYHTYAELTQSDRAESTLGYYSPFYDQLFLYEGATDVNGLETLHVLYHEAFHHYFYGVVAAPPTWLDEGLADYHAGKVLEGELGGKKDPDAQQMVAEVQSALAEGWKADFGKLMRMTQGEFYGDGAYTRYSQAWSMCYWFQEAAPQEVREAFGKYVTALCAGKSGEAALAEAFGAQDLAAVEKAWREWITALKYE